MPPPANWFIGLPVDANALPPGTLAELPRGCRAYHHADLHITVAFLGAVGEERALCAWQRLSTERLSVLETALGGRAVFGPPRRPSALGLDLDRDGTELTALLSAWRDPLRDAAGLEREQRPVRPHLTLARPPRRVDRAWRRRLDEWLTETAPQGRLRIGAIALFTRAPEADANRFRRARSHQLPGPGDNRTSPVGGPVVE